MCVCRSRLRRRWRCCLHIGSSPAASRCVETSRLQRDRSTAIRLCMPTPIDTSRLVERDRRAVEDALAGWWPASMKNRRQRVAWWREARFGCFIHWGVYSGPGGEWEGQPFKGYAEHLMRIKKIPRARYAKDVA